MSANSKLGVRVRLLLTILLLLQTTIAFASDLDRPKGHNCELTAPPANSGEEFNHGITLKIYPRAKNISTDYSGCQIVWAPIEKRWSEVIVVSIQAGDPVRLWSPDKSDPVRTSCIYKKGKVIRGDAEHCAAAEFLIVRSLAPGCVEKIKKAVAAGGIGAQRPTGCDYE